MSAAILSRILVDEQKYASEAKTVAEIICCGIY